MKKSSLIVLTLAAAALTSGCRQDMRDQEKYKPLAYSDFFGDKLSARQPVEGTIARGFLKLNKHYWEGQDENGQFVNELPIEFSRDLLVRGQQRYNIYCAPCHDRAGSGNGMIVRRGYKQPPTYHDDRLRSQPLGYFYNVITHGFGVMPDYASQVPVEDRWAIAAYVRVLQLSQHAGLELVPEDRQAELEKAQLPAPAEAPAEEPAPQTEEHS